MKFVNLNCAWCEKEYSRLKKKYNEALKKGYTQFCSKECNSLYMKNFYLYKRIFPDVLFKPTPQELKNQKYYCEKCRKKHNGFYGYGRFCCQKCAKQFAASINKEAANKKTSETLRERNRILRKEGQLRPLEITNICVICGKSFTRKYNKKDQKCCSQKCASKLNWQNPKYRKNLVDKMKQKVKDGTHSGWKSRQGLKPSFAEQFFIKVLNNNKIYFKREHKHSKYFLDFFIEKNGRQIDFEVDGKQHEWPERVASDKKRDEFLIKEGLEVYRIKWKHPKKYSDYIKEEIDKLLEFINKVE